MMVESDKKPSIEQQLRWKIQSEESAVSEYRDCIKNTTNEDVKRVLTEILEDELTHIGALRELLDTLSSVDEQKQIDIGRKEAQNLIGSKYSKGKQNTISERKKE